MLKILIVDDSRTVRKIVRRALEAYGYTALEEAKDGIEAIEHFKQKSFDCMFTDINMPNMDGFELLKWLGEQKLLDTLEVVAISTEVANIGSDEMLALGIDQAIPKPFSREEFEKIAISLLGTIESSRDIQELSLEYKDEIIIADDSSSMRGVIKRQLKLYRCNNTYEAANGREALERINEISMERDGDKQTIIFLDLNMPIMDGLELIEMLEQNGLIDIVKIILLSGSLDMAKNAVDGRNIVAALPKPFKQKEFTATFTPLLTDSILSEGSSFDELEIVAMPKGAHSMEPDEFFDTLFSPLYVNIDKFLGQKTLKQINHKLFKQLDSLIYTPIYQDTLANLDSSQKKLLFAKDAVLNLKEKLTIFQQKPAKEYFESIYIKNYTPYNELTNRYKEQKSALEQNLNNHKKIDQYIKKNPKKAEEYIKKQEDIQKTVQSKKLLLQDLDKQRKVMYQNSYDEFSKAFEKISKKALSTIESTLGSIVYRYDKYFWINIKQSCGKICVETPWLNSLSYLENLELDYSELTKDLEHLRFRNILCVGFEHKRAQLLKGSLENEFRDFDITLLQNPDINYCPTDFEPNLIIINYLLTPEKIEPFLEELKTKYLLLNEELNLLYILSSKLSASELSSNIDKCLFNLKLKNYINLPTNKDGYKEVCRKAKELIS
ncbi:MAG: response regulator [Campylobacterales bacterium]